MIKLIKLYSTSCVPCKLLDEKIRKPLINSNTNTNIEFEAINTDEDQELATKLKIGSVPQLILNNEGIYTKYKGDMHDLSAITQWIINHLS